MVIPVKCQCGKKYQAKDAFAGGQIKCPACGQIVVVPKHARSGKPHSIMPKASNNGTYWMIVAAAGLVAVIVILLVYSVVFVPGAAEPDAAGDHAESAPSDTSNDSGEAAAAERFPRLPGAVSSPPPYLVEDAPFDMLAFFETPQADQNAAPRYLDALFEFSLDVGGCFPEAEQMRRVPIVRQRQQRSYELQERRMRNENAVDRRELDRALQDYSVGFEKLDLAQQRPACVFEPAIGIAALLPHAQAAREVARWTDIKTQRDVEQGRFDEALKNIERLLRLSRDLQRRGLSVTQLVGVAINSICYQGCVKRVLAAPNLTTDHCDRLLELLAIHEQQAVDPLLESLRSEYVTIRSTLHDVKYQTGDFDPEFLKDELAVDSIGALITGLVPGGSVSDHAASEIDAYADRMTDADYAREVATANELYASVIKVADHPYRDQIRDISAAFARPRTSETPLVSLLSGGFPETLQAFVRGKAELHGTQCLVALRRWQLRQPNTTPPDLETVTKAAGMPNVPGDPYGDGPLRMIQRQGQFVIYSVGKDGKDDQAQSDWQYGQQPGDFIFGFARE